MKIIKKMLNKNKVYLNLLRKKINPNNIIKYKFKTSRLSNQSKIAIQLKKL